MSATFLRELAEVIDDDGDCRRLDGEDVTKVRAAADHVDALEREIHKRADAQLERAIDKERLIYHLIAMLTCHPDENRTPRDLARLCLEHFGYPVDCPRARRMLELGEPGGKSSTTGGDAALPAFMRAAVSSLVRDVVDEVALQGRYRTAVELLREWYEGVPSNVAGDKGERTRAFIEGES